VIFNAAVPEFREKRIFRTERADILDSPDPPASVVQNKQAPAPVVLADFRPCKMDGAIRKLTSRTMPEKRARVGKFFKDALVQKELSFIRIYGNRRFFPGVLVIDQKPEIPVILPDAVNEAQVAAAFPALETFKGQSPDPLTGCSAR
jgi:hypothetical protein